MRLGHRFTWAVTAVGARHGWLRKVDPGRIWELFDAEAAPTTTAARTVQALLPNHENAHNWIEW